MDRVRVPTIYKEGWSSYAEDPTGHTHFP